MNTERIQVMIGEDDHLLALRMQKELQLLGYAVQIRAGTPQEIVLLAATMRPDVILLDLNIGGDTHGVGVARDIHDITTIPTVFLSACPEEIAENAHAIPRPYRYVTKPFTGGDVHSAIQDLLSWRIPRRQDVPATNREDGFEPPL